MGSKGVEKKGKGGEKQEKYVDEFSLTNVMLGSAVLLWLKYEIYYILYYILYYFPGMVCQLNQ